MTGTLNNIVEKKDLLRMGVRIRKPGDPSMQNLEQIHSRE